MDINEIEKDFDEMIRSILRWAVYSILVLLIAGITYVLITQQHQEDFGYKVVMLIANLVFMGCMAYKVYRYDHLSFRQQYYNMLCKRFNRHPQTYGDEYYIRSSGTQVYETRCTHCKKLVRETRYQ